MSASKTSGETSGRVTPMPCPELVELKVEHFDEESPVNDDHNKLEQLRLKRLKKLRKQLIDSNYWESLRQKYLSTNAELIHSDSPVTKTDGNLSEATHENGSSGNDSPAEEITENLEVMHQTEATEKPSVDYKCICEMCGQTFHNRKGMLTHMEGYHDIPGTAITRANKTFFKCKFCELEFTARTQLFLHCNLVHSEEITLTSKKICNTEHVKTEDLSTQSRFCTTCNVESENLEKFIAHLEQNHAETFCDICYQVFVDSTYLMLHRRVHFAENPYACDLCPKVFKSLHHVGEHRRGHTGDKPNQCAQCPLAFARIGDLNKHVKAQHVEEPSYKCSLCPRTFHSSSSFHQHKQKHRLAAEAGVPFSDLSFTCNRCGQSFENGSRKKREHALTCDSEGRPHACPTCGKRFKLSGHLKAHQQTHTGVKQHCCDQCPVAFYLPGDLRRHQKRHERNSQKC
ncbi:zinc finger protein 271-like [Sabethes cyaneus]|uniref:zinc finger protein 271-like n=1 Tax=Sabethes cyaneus TaxID=53552 RepID=UPI00237E7B9E|nr:zinc finger protein 271-like [Sabethes cyaneus]